MNVHTLPTGALAPNPRLTALSKEALAAHVLQALARARLEGRSSNLETLTQELGVRRGDVRRTITLLHHQGFVDALRTRLTLAGFALGRAYLERGLPPLRREAAATAAA